MGEMNYDKVPCCKTSQAITITDLNYDQATISDCVADAQKILLEIENAAAQVGLCINIKKINFMSFNFKVQWTISVEEMERQ